MKITDVRTMTLKGPRPHNVGGEEGVETQLILQVETDAGVYGLAEAEDFMGVREAIDYLRALSAGALSMLSHSALKWFTVPCHPIRASQI